MTSLRVSWPTMGSMASLAVPGAAPAHVVSAAADQVRAWFEEVERVLSPYRGDSDLSRWRDGRASLAACSPLLGDVVTACTELQEITGGGFCPIDRQGRYDPTGFVKGWAVQQGVELLAGAGIVSANLGIGGDLQMVGLADDSRRPWRTAVVDPGDGRRIRALLAASEDGSPFAVATSGASQRGEHIWPALGRWRPGAPRAARTWRSITVAGPRLSLADAFATAVWAGALVADLEQAWAFLAGTGYEALALDHRGALRTTPGMRQYLVDPRTRQPEASADGLQRVAAPALAVPAVS